MQALSKNPKECIYLLYHDRNITAMCVVGFKSEQRFQYFPPGQVLACSIGIG